VSGNDLRCGTCGTDHHPAEECDCLDCGVCASCVERSRAHHEAMTAPTPADAARWLRENGYGLLGHDEAVAAIFAEHAAHVLGRVEAANAGRLKSARKMLSYYGECREDCATKVSGFDADPRCDCGLEEALETLAT